METVQPKDTDSNLEWVAAQGPRAVAAKIAALWLIARRLRDGEHTPPDYLDRLERGLHELIVDIDTEGAS